MIELVIAGLGAGFIYTVTPGPIFFSVVSTLAFNPRKSAWLLSLGGLAGDIFWIGLGVISLAMTSLFAPIVFQILAFLCGAYLVYLGVRAFVSHEKGAQNKAINAKSPLQRGLMLGFLNPKSYPVITALLTGMVGTGLPDLPLLDLIVLYSSVIAGCIITYCLDIYVLSSPIIKNTFLRHTSWITRGVGVLFTFFGLMLLYDLFVSVFG